MERKKIVAANWKMNTTRDEAIHLVQQITGKNVSSNGVVKLIFPPFPFIAEVAGKLKDHRDFHAGAQNCSQYAKGAYTGEISCSMIHSVGGEFVLVGHSERRKYFNENAEILNAKIKQALDNNLNVIYCFGEQLNERKSNRHFVTVKQQLEEVIRDYPLAKMDKLVLAYEPVWAIGTGENASPAQAQEMHAFVRGWLSATFPAGVSEKMSILYGGSCNAQNAKELFACADVDGGLIGGASLNAEEFCKIITSF